MSRCNSRVSTGDRLLVQIADGAVTPAYQTYAVWPTAVTDEIVLIPPEIARILRGERP